MDHEQESKKSMGSKVRIFNTNTDNAAEYAGYTAMEDAETKLETILGDWDDLAAKEAVELAGPGADSTAKKKAMSIYWGAVSNTAVSWASDTGNTELGTDWKHADWEIMGLENNAAAALCKHLYDDIKLHKDDAGMAAHGITLAILDAGKVFTDAFKGTIGKPKEHRDEKTAVGVLIDTLISDRFDKHMVYMDGLVNGIYFLNKQGFVEGYHAARGIDKIPTHHTVASFVFTNVATGDFIKGVKVKNIDTGKEDLSTVVGEAEIKGKGFKGGKNLEFEFTHPDYVGQTKIITVKKGKHVDTAVAMVHV